MRLSAVAVALLVAVFAACSGGEKSRRDDTPPKADAPPPAAAKPATDFAALAARELAALPEKPFAAADGWFSARSEAAGDPSVQAGQGMTVVNIPLGTGSPLSCFFYAEPFDMAAALLRGVRAMEKTVKLRRARLTDVIPVGDKPMLLLGGDYEAEQDGKKMAGMVKLAAFNSGGHSMLCVHDEFGYTASFRRIVTGLAGAVVYKDAPRAPAYAEVHVLRLNGTPVGASSVELSRAGDGLTTLETDTSMVLVRGPAELMATDEVELEVTDAKGVLQQKAFFAGEGGELQQQVKLTRGPKGTYTFEGKLAGKDLKGSFTAPELGGQETFRMRIRELVKRPGPDASVAAYTPSLDPSGPTTVTLRKDGADPAAVRLVIGDKEVLNWVDAQGMGVRSEMKIGSMVLATERLVARGTPP